ncbi:MAG: PQQ-dependent sugar dehydrogenase [Nitrososphaeraceae archaeon]
MWLVFFGILGAVVISWSIISEYFVQGTLNHIAIAIDSKYPELALSSPKGPIINDPQFKAEIVFKGLKYSTSMVFLGPNDILVAEKDSGTVRRIVNGAMLQQPLLDVNVATYGHRGMLGIAVDSSLLENRSSEWHNNSTATPTIPTYVFLYYTEAQGQDGDDITKGKEPLGNRLYRYELVNNKLVNPKLLVDLPATPGAIGIGGKVMVGPDNNVYVTIGDVGIDGHDTKAQNVQNGLDADGTSGILRISKDGSAILPGVLGNKFPLNLYYSYGIWNSFGIDFDPVTGNLWDTENGLIFGDEINLVKPGFNSGYTKIDGIWLRGYPIDQTEKHIAPRDPRDLVNFDGKGAYHIPQFTWFRSVGPTGITFFNSNKMGFQYENGIFVGDIINGNIYHFRLAPNRTELLLPTGPIEDRVVNSSDTLDGIIFGRGFGGITDIKVGPDDGYLYVLTFDSSQGTIFRIVPKGPM